MERLHAELHLNKSLLQIDLLKSLKKQSSSTALSHAFLVPANGLSGNKIALYFPLSSCLRAHFPWLYARPRLIPATALAGEVALATHELAGHTLREGKIVRAAG